MTLDTTNYARAINVLADEIADLAERKGFWEFDHIGIDSDSGAIPLKLVLIASEVSEALDVHRREYDDSDEDAATGMTSMQEDAFTEELADIVIRTLDLAAAFGFDIGQIILDKIEVNRNRPYRHGKRY